MMTPWMVVPTSCPVGDTTALCLALLLHFIGALLDQCDGMQACLTAEQEAGTPWNGNSCIGIQMESPPLWVPWPPPPLGLNAFKLNAPSVRRWPFWCKMQLTQRMLALCHATHHMRERCWSC